jgi:hypothetical protein
MFAFDALPKNRVLFGACAALALSSALSALAQDRPPKQRPPFSAQARSALDFLARLGRGDVKGAHLKLDPDVRRTYAIGKLAAVARGRQGVATVRHIGYEAYLPPAQGGRRQSAAAGSLRRPYLVCVVEVPQSGTGSVNYISITSVLRVYVARSEWMIVDFRISSEPDSSCR